MTVDEGLLRQFILDHLRKAAAEKGLTLEELRDDSNLLDLALLDSLGFIELLAGIQAHFDIEMDFSDLDPSEFTTLGGITSLALKAGSTAG